LENEVHNTRRPLIVTASVKSESTDLIYNWTVGDIDLNDKGCTIPLRYTFYQVVEIENGETIDQPLHPSHNQDQNFSLLLQIKI
jgi:hypothetical protein